MVAMNLTTEN